MTRLDDRSVSGPRPCSVCGGETGRWARPVGEWVYDRCASCGHADLRQQPSPDELQQYYDAAYRYSEDALAAAVECRYLHRVRWAEGIVGLRERRVLEVGCNTGRLLLALRESGWQVAGTELGAQFRQVAQQRGLDVRPALRDFAGERFPLVVSFHVLEHVPDAQEELRTVRERLTSGGALLLKTPNVGCLAARLFPDEWEWSSPPAHLRLFSEESLRRSLEAAGFEVRALEYERGNARPLPFQVLRAMALRLRGRSRRYTPGLDSRHIPVAGRPWYRAAERLGALLGTLGAPLMPILRALSLLPELTLVATQRR